MTLDTRLAELASYKAPIHDYYSEVPMMKMVAALAKACIAYRSMLHGPYLAHSYSMKETYDAELAKALGIAEGKAE
jgi:hypothetical protein